MRRSLVRAAKRTIENLLWRRNYEIHTNIRCIHLIVASVERNNVLCVSSMCLVGKSLTYFGNQIAILPTKIVESLEELAVIHDIRAEEVADELMVG